MIDISVVLYRLQKVHRYTGNRLLRVVNVVYEAFVCQCVRIRICQNIRILQQCMSRILVMSKYSVNGRELGGGLRPPKP